MSYEAKEKLAIFITSLLFLILIAFLFFAIWKVTFSPKIELTKSEWECTKFDKRLVPVSLGKTNAILPKKICTQYHRK